MYFWFFICIFGAITVVPVHFLSVEHLKLQGRYGTKKGIEIGKILGLISGWGFFLFWMGIWISPQPRFILPFFQNPTFFIPVFGFSIYFINLILSIFFITLGAWLGIKGVKQTTLEVAETHRTEKIVTTGVYSIVRHPQYFGGLLAHMGISFLLSARYSLIFTPLIFVLVYLVSKKEEEELIREFGKEYKKYSEKVPMFIPRIHNKKKKVNL
jgi:protein-S-isoprenylcysteine O-methyltransferase Ste14